MSNEPELQPQEEDQQNPAVLRCCHAWQAAYDHAIEYMDVPDHKARELANIAFRDAMPPLAGKQNIRDYIACVACGLLKGAILHMYVPRLLYAAQIAVTADGPSKPYTK